MRPLYTSDRNPSQTIVDEGHNTEKFAKQGQHGGYSYNMCGCCSVIQKFDYKNINLLIYKGNSLEITPIRLLNNLS